MKRMSSNKCSLLFLLAATFFVFLNFNISLMVTPVYILAIGGTEFFSGLQTTLFSLTAVVLRFYFGPLADAKGNKITLFIGSMAFMTAPLLFLFSQSLWYVLLVRMYQAIGLAAYLSSASAVVSALAPGGKVGAYIGYYRFVTVLTLLVGPSAALKVIDEYGYYWYHGLGIVIGLLAMVFLHFVHEPQKYEKTCNHLAKPGFKMLGLLREKKSFPIFESLFLLAVCYGLVLTFTAIYIRQAVPEINPGLFFTVFGIGSIISNLTAGTLSDSKGRAAVVFPWIIIMGLGLVLLYFLPFKPWIIYLGGFFTGFGFSGSIAVLITWVVDVVPVTRRATALALQENTVDIGIGLGSFFFGLFIPLIGIPWCYGASGLLLILFGVWKIFGIVLVKETPR